MICLKIIMSMIQPIINPIRANINTILSVAKYRLVHHPAKKRRIGRTGAIITPIKMDSNLLNAPPPRSHTFQIIPQMTYPKKQYTKLAAVAPFYFYHTSCNTQTFGSIYSPISFSIFILTGSNAP